AKVSNIIEKEEDNFLSTVDAGLERINRIFTAMHKQRRGTVSGAEAADMFQTHGFPPELFETLAAERNFTFDWAGFQDEMKRHGDISGATEKVQLFKRDPLEALKKAVHGSVFLGYETLEVKDAKVLGIISNEQLCDQIDEVDHENPIILVLDKTPFYGEMGGQVGDVGQIEAQGFCFEVTDSQVEGAFTLHVGHLREGKIELGAVVSARVDAARRAGIRRAHSATHLLHYALRKHLGAHAMQQGSKVDDDLLRFDFSNPSAVSPAELQKIEIETNELIMACAPIHWENMPLAEARKTGAMMLFGEKYPDVVRLVSMGDFSKELCGGTHLENSGQIGFFKIIGEESVAAGTRRITALTGRAALDLVQRTQAILAHAAATLKVPAENLTDRLESFVKELRELKKKAAGAGVKAEKLGADQLFAQAEEIAGVKVIVAEASGGPGELRQVIDLLRRKNASLAVLLGNAQPEEKKVMLIAGLTKDLVAKGLDAVAWVRAVSKIVGGSGGGRPDMAQAGGKLPEKLADALAEGKETIKKMLGGVVD
ncbi:MAG: alanine--tRNA ligase-related protein, partial [Thermoguttaceae bacterium]